MHIKDINTKLVSIYRYDKILANRDIMPKKSKLSRESRVFAKTVLRMIRRLQVEEYVKTRKKKTVAVDADDDCEVVLPLANVKQNKPKKWNKTKRPKSYRERKRGRGPMKHRPGRRR